MAIKIVDIAMKAAIMFKVQIDLRTIRAEKQSIQFSQINLRPIMQLVDCYCCRINY